MHEATAVCVRLVVHLAVNGGAGHDRITWRLYAFVCLNSEQRPAQGILRGTGRSVILRTKSIGGTWAALEKHNIRSSVAVEVKFAAHGGISRDEV